MKPYIGNEKYIFVSYAHKDSADVLKDIDTLQKRGYRVWYDEGIDPGTEWDENIAAHVENCGYFIAFISRNYLESENCKDELNYARDLGKNRLLVYIEDCRLPSGMAMRLNRLQNIHKSSYTDYNEYINKIETSKDIALCKGSAVNPVSSQPADNFRTEANNISTAQKREVYSDGSVYDGEMLNGKRHGHGIFTFADGRKYDGEYKDDKKNGHGVFTWPNGDKYDGEWKDDVRHGHGVYTFADERKYDGEWKNDKCNGYGVRTYANGEIVEGIWENGELVKKF